MTDPLRPHDERSLTRAMMALNLLKALEKHGGIDITRGDKTITFHFDEAHFTSAWLAVAGTFVLRGDATAKGKA